MPASKPAITLLTNTLRRLPTHTPSPVLPRQCLRALQISSLHNQHRRPSPLQHHLNVALVSQTPRSQQKTYNPFVRSLATLSTESYHRRADSFIEALVAVLEELQEQREDVDVEYSAGVLTLIFPPNGTYVLNKQPPNKQIWLSSPVSGPKRFDWQENDWVYLRDGSSLRGIMEKELGVRVDESGGEEV